MEEQRSEEWLREGVNLTARDFHRFVLEDVADGRETMRLEMRCIYDGHIRLEYEMRLWAMPYRPWAVYRGLVRFWLKVRLLFTGRCAQCKFEKKARRW